MERIESEDVNLNTDTTMARWRAGTFNCRPPNGREFVWSRKRSSSLIEDILNGLPVQPIVVNRTSTGPDVSDVYDEVVDGLQRITTQFTFIEGTNPWKASAKEGWRLMGLVMMPELNGMSFQDLRVVDAHAKAVLTASLGEFLHRVALERRGIDDVEGARFAREHGEAVVVFGHRHDILHPGLPGQPGPLVGVELDGVELRRELCVFLHRDVRPILDPFADARILRTFPLTRGNGVEPPGDQHPELGVAEPLGSASDFGIGLRVRQPRRQHRTHQYK